jgi:hypothetical protein
VERRSARIVIATGLAAILVAAAVLRQTEIGAGLPYIYQEDEGHHFSRLVSMVKNGTFDPHYFNKPSLHFYLRMPVVAAAYIWAVKQGDLTALKELQTVDRYPDGEEDWVVSHPRIAVWSRTFSVVISLALVVVTFLLAKQVTGSGALALGAAWFTAVSPALVVDAPKIGVDTLMALMSLIAISAALRVLPAPSSGGFLLAGVLAGLAVSSKYNAAPIAVVPVLAALISNPRAVGPAALAIAGVVAGFLAGTPYALLRLPAFLDDVAFEVRHYGELGHGANTGEPGWDQARFYVSWLATWGAGYAVTIAGIAGLGVLAARRSAASLLFLIYPFLFFLLMIDQVVNFPRNILVLIPVLAIGAMAALQALPRRVPRRSLVVLLAVLLASIQPLRASLRLRGNAAALSPDSRARAIMWVTQHPARGGRTAAAPSLRLPRAMMNSARIVELKQANVPSSALAGQGFSRLLASSGFLPPDAGYEIERIFPGDRRPAKFPVNPEVVVFRVHPSAALDPRPPAP